MRKTILLACILWLAPSIAWAQTTEDLQQKIKILEERLQALEDQVRTLTANQAAGPSSTAAAVAAVSVPGGQIARGSGVPRGQPPQRQQRLLLLPRRQPRPPRWNCRPARL